MTAARSRRPCVDAADGGNDAKPLGGTLAFAIRGLRERRVEVADRSDELRGVADHIDPMFARAEVVLVLRHDVMVDEVLRALRLLTAVIERQGAEAARAPWGEA